MLFEIFISVAKAKYVSLVCNDSNEVCGQFTHEVKNMIRSQLTPLPQSVGIIEISSSAYISKFLKFFVVFWSHKKTLIKIAKVFRIFLKMTTEKLLLSDPSIGRITIACSQCAQRSVDEPSYDNLAQHHNDFMYELTMLVLLSYYICYPSNLRKFCNM